MGKYRRPLMKFHLVCALAGVILFLLQAGSGMLLSWRWDMAQLIDPAGMTASPSRNPQTINSIFDDLAKQLPEVASLRVFFPHADDGVYFLHMKTSEGMRYASVDPGNGELLRFGTVWRFPVEAALKLHIQPLPGIGGQVLVFVTGLLLTLMSITGLLIWWPKPGTLRRSLAVNWRHPAKALVRTSHRTAGVVLAPFLLMMSLTGLLMIAEILLGISAPAAGANPAHPPLRGGEIERALNLSENYFPGEQVRDLRVGGGVATVQFQQADAGAWDIHRVALDLTKGEAIEVTDARDNDALWAKLLPFHTGTILGTAGRSLVLVIALGLVMLAGMGMFLAFTKPRRPRRT